MIDHRYRHRWSEHVLAPWLLSVAMHAFGVLFQQHIVPARRRWRQMTFRSSGVHVWHMMQCTASCASLLTSTPILHVRFCIKHLRKVHLVITCRAYKLGKRRWSYNQCELVLHQDDASGPGNVLTAVGDVYQKQSDSEELCTDPEGQVREIEKMVLATTQLTPGVLPVHELVA